MIYLTVLINVTKEKEVAFLDIAKPLIENSAQEAGCSAYYLTKTNNAQYNYILHEQWESEEALEAHRQTHHYQVGVPKLVEVTEILLPISEVEYQI